MCESGGLMAGATKNECSLLAKFGEHLGVMIQLLDDLDGVFAPNGQGDLANQKQCNSVLVHGLHGDYGKEVRDLFTHNQVKPLSMLLLESGSASAVLAAALQERNLAMQTLEELPPKSGQMAALGLKRLTNFAYGVFSQLPEPISQWIESSQGAFHVQGDTK
jgi:geranylgeranyl pyrophosphate synthase